MLLVCMSPTMACALRAAAAKVLRQAVLSGQGMPFFAPKGSLSRDFLSLGSSSVGNVALDFSFASPAMLSFYPATGTYLGELVEKACCCLSPYQVTFQNSASKNKVSPMLLAGGIGLGGYGFASSSSDGTGEGGADLEKEIEQLKKKLRSSQEREALLKKSVEEAKVGKEEIAKMGKRLVEMGGGGGGGGPKWWMRLVKNKYVHGLTTVYMFPFLIEKTRVLFVEGTTGWYVLWTLVGALIMRPQEKFKELVGEQKDHWKEKATGKMGGKEKCPETGRCLCGKEVPVVHRCQFCGRALPATGAKSPEQSTAAPSSPAKTPESSAAAAAAPSSPSTPPK